MPAIPRRLPQIESVSWAGQLVIAKRFPQMDILFVTAVAAGVSAMISAPFMSLNSLAPVQIANSVLYGLVPVGLGTALALAGGRLIKSGEAGFIAMLDIVLGPLWVWALFSEQPAIATAIGGSLVLVAVTWYLMNETDLAHAEPERS